MKIHNKKTNFPPGGERLIICKSPTPHKFCVDDHVEPSESVDFCRAYATRNTAAALKIIS